MLELEVELTDRLNGMTWPETARFFERKIESLDGSVEAHLPLTTGLTEVNVK